MPSLIEQITADIKDEQKKKEIISSLSFHESSIKKQDVKENENATVNVVRFVLLQENIFVNTTNKISHLL